MSFSSDLGGNLELVQKHSKERRKGLEELIQMLSERTMYEEFYAEGLLRIATHPFTVTSQGSLAKVVTAMKEECVARAAAVRQFSKELSCELVDTLRVLLRQQNEEVKTVANHVKTAKKSIDSLKKSLEKAKKDYNAQCQLSEEFVKNVECVRSASEKKKHIAQRADGINAAMKAAVKTYKEAIPVCNLALPKYQETLKEALSAYQRQEEQRLKAMGEVLKTLWRKTAAHDEELAAEGRNREEVRLTQVYNKFNAYEDIQLFISENRSLPAEEAPDHIFESYKGTHWAFADLGEAAPEIAWVGNDCISVPKLPSSQSEDSEADSACRARLEELMSRAWRGDICAEVKDEFGEAVRNSRARKSWVSYMNACRAEGKFRMSSEGFEAVAELLIALLDECESANDIATVKSCIILSQTFYHLKSSEKEFLQARITAHTVWRGEAIWTAIVKDGIDTEFEKQRLCGSERQEADTSWAFRLTRTSVCATSYSVSSAPSLMSCLSSELTPPSRERS